jgi:hypothetical protein
MGKLQAGVPDSATHWQQKCHELVAECRKVLVIYFAEALFALSHISPMRMFIQALPLALELAPALALALARARAQAHTYKAIYDPIRLQAWDDS